VGFCSTSPAQLSLDPFARKYANESGNFCIGFECLDFLIVQILHRLDPPAPLHQVRAETSFVAPAAQRSLINWQKWLLILGRWLTT
jgi:hypothetical protein